VERGKEYVFSGIDRSDYSGLYNFLSGKKIRIKNLQEEDTAPSGPVYDENVIYGLEEGGAEMEESSDDEDYGTGDDESDDDASSESGDDDDLGSGFEDSDLEDYAKSKKKKKKKAKKAESSSDDDSDDSDDDGGDGGKSSKKRRKKGSGKGDKSPKKKAKKDPNAPKKSLTAYMIFSTSMRPTIKEQNPDASFGDLVSSAIKTYIAHLCVSTSELTDSLLSFLFSS
jgi:structure-specific recognition protein 1